MVGRGSQNVTGLYIEKSHFPSLPREFEIALDYYYHDERTGGQTAQAARIHPLCEFNTQLPRYAAELYQIYRHARIMAIDITMEVVNTSSTEPLIAAIGVLPLVNANALTSPQTIASVPGTIFKQIGLATGMSKAVLRRRCVTEKYLGELTIGSNTYLQTYSEALASAVWTELPAIYGGVIAAKNGATWTGIVDYRLTFHIRWSELNIPSLGIINKARAQGLKKSPPVRDDTENDEEEEMWEMPPPALMRNKGTRVGDSREYAASIRGSK